MDMWSADIRSDLNCRLPGSFFIGLPAGPVLDDFKVGQEAQHSRRLLDRTTTLLHLRVGRRT